MSVTAEEANNNIMKSFTKSSIKRGFFPEGAFNVRVASDPAMSKQQTQPDDIEESTPVLDVVVEPQSSETSSSSAPPSATKTTTNKPSSSSSRALFTFPSKWDDAEKWLKSSSGKSSGKKKQHMHGFRKLHNTTDLLQQDEQSDDKEKKMTMDSEVSVVVSRFSFPMVGKASSSSSSSPSPSSTAHPKNEDLQKNQQEVGHLRIQKPTTDLNDVHTCFDFMQSQQQPKSPTSLYESVSCLAPGPRSICMRDMGTEMTPIASQEPSRTGTPLRTPTMVSPRVSPGKIRPIPPPPQPGISRAVPPDSRETKTVEEILVIGTQLGKNNITAWASKEEEEEDASKCLKVVIQQGADNNIRPSLDLVEVRKTMVESRAVAWEEAEQAKYTARYEREEAKIIAWENHQKAKAEAELRKMEVKVERMRSHAHERMMNKLAAARRRAEELRAAAEAKKGEKAAKAAQRAGEIRRTGRMSSSSTNFLRCCLAGV